MKYSAPQWVRVSKDRYELPGIGVVERMSPGARFWSPIVYGQSHKQQNSVINAKAKVKAVAADLVKRLVSKGRLISVNNATEV